MVVQIVGQWFGDGEITYPTLTEKFGNKAKPYKETITIVDTKQPFLSYLQTTTINGKAKHSESGFLRFPKNENKIEFVVAQCTGITETSSGIITCETPPLTSNENESKKNDSSKLISFEFSVESDSITSSQFGTEPKVKSVKRLFKFDHVKKQLSYKVFMKTTTHKDYALHLQCILKRK